MSGREQVRISTKEETKIPEWWARLFASRQRDVRNLALALLGRHGRISSTQIRQFISYRYETVEISHALGRLEVEGLVVHASVTEGFGYKKSFVKQVEYYELPGEE